MESELIYWIWLSQCFPYGSIKPLEVIEKYGSAYAFYQNRHEGVKEIEGLTKREYQNITTIWANEYLPYVELLKKKGICAISYNHEDYPKRLNEIDNPPMVLYYIGDIKLLQRRIISMVGTRKISASGKKAAFVFSSELARRGIVIMSGCAVGGDAAAHWGALECGQTIAVLGTSLDAVYPASNLALKRAILDKHGLIITEYPLKTETKPQLFPIRNRLISALADATVILEAPNRSGALITARHAMEQGRELFFLPPANILNPQFDMMKQYIRDGARLMLGIQDIIDFYRFHPNTEIQCILEEYIKSVEEKSKKTEKGTCNSDAKAVLLKISEGNDTMERLSELLSLSLPKLMTVLTELEIEGRVRKEGNRYLFLH